MQVIEILRLEFGARYLFLSVYTQNQSDLMPVELSYHDLHPRLRVCDVHGIYTTRGSDWMAVSQLDFHIFVFCYCRPMQQEYQLIEAILHLGSVHDGQESDERDNSHKLEAFPD